MQNLGPLSFCMEINKKSSNGDEFFFQIDYYRIFLNLVINNFTMRRYNPLNYSLQAQTYRKSTGSYFFNLLSHNGLFANFQFDLRHFFLKLDCSTPNSVAQKSLLVFCHHLCFNNLINSLQLVLHI